ncbi:hypothetical protein [Thalassomonas haliotis]|uniref:Lipoprotein n=1 Tax=Thalassomonas haliotis TaxID=485448 RepID=A0ABY7V9K5_9GAMM|nr:hypothetical protein [Thalassomonas haliotis]WDE10280.1 hypothetical protein H3N35_18625 [Thalassomonas haliotis]
MKKYSLLFVALLATGCRLADPVKQPLSPELKSSQVLSAQVAVQENAKENCQTVYRHKRTPIRLCTPIAQD